MDGFKSHSWSFDRYPLKKDDRMAIINFNRDKLLDETMEKTIAAFIKMAEKEQEEKDESEGK